MRHPREIDVDAEAGARFVEPTERRAGRADVLAAYLDFFRERAIEKVLGLNPDDVVTSRLPSGWTPLQLLHHLRWVEHRWVEWGFLGAEVDDPWGDERDGRWHVPPELTADAVVDGLRAQGRRTREIAV